MTSDVYVGQLPSTAIRTVNYRSLSAATVAQLQAMVRLIVRGRQLNGVGDRARGERGKFTARTLSVQSSAYRFDIESVWVAAPFSPPSI
jgi:hypothetical protein